MFLIFMRYVFVEANIFFVQTSFASGFINYFSEG